MVRKRVPKTGRGRVDGSVMQRAVLEVENGKSVREVSKCLKVDRSTLSRYVKKVKSGLMPRDSPMLPKFNTRQVFSETEESCLADYILKCSAMFHGMGQQAVRRLAFQFGFRNGKRMPNNWQKDAKAGEDWMQGFLRRQNHLSLRKPEATSIARAQSFNQKAVDEFFTLIRKEMTRLHCSADNIYNLDESGITTVQSAPKVIAQKGLKQVGQITASERGCLVTVCCCVNAVGRVLPPAMIFPRVHYKSHMTHGAPTGTLGLATNNGWMNSDLFVKVFKHFVSNIGCSKNKPIIMLMDNHESHLSIDIVDHAIDNGVTIITFPPHCSHRLQPLDVSVYGLLKRYYNKAVDEWNLSNPGKRISIYDLPACFARAFNQAFTYSNISNGFHKTGIWPLNSDIFSESDFLPSQVFKPAAASLSPKSSQTENTYEKQVSLSSNVIEKLSKLPTEFVVEQYNDTTEKNIETSLELLVENETETEVGTHENTALCSLSLTTDAANSLVIPEAIRPLPKIENTECLQKRKRKRGSAKIITSTPIKILLQESSKKKEELKQRKQKSKVPLKVVQCLSGKFSPRSLNECSDFVNINSKNLLDDKKKGLKKRKQMRKAPHTASKSRTRKNLDLDSESDEDWPCLVCTEPFIKSKPGEQWIQCSCCLKWAHEDCTPGISANYICHNCNSDDDI